ncbi:MAG: hypothetical protein MMC33_008426 [Icmadophila ericetorum]|nr:hypothetical protein [Icmadophila ericetorum]
MLQPTRPDKTSVFAETWAINALNDTVLLEAVLFHASIHLDEVHSRPRSTATFHHLGKSIHLLNGRLHCAEKATIDSTIGAVGFLGATGNITGDTSNDTVHKIALRRLIDMRGSLQNLGWNGTLAILLSIGDLISSVISQSAPGLVQPEFKDAIPSGTSRLHKEDRYNYVEFSDFREEILELVDTISHLAGIQEIISTKSEKTAAEVMMFHQSCLSIEYRLLSMQASNSNFLVHSSTARQFSTYVYQASQIAALICVNYNLRHLRPGSVIFVSLERSLAAVLANLDGISSQVVMDTAEMEILLWVCVVAALTSISKDKATFLPRIWGYMEVLGYCSWPDVERCVKCFVWARKMQEQCSILVADLVCVK